MQPLVLGCMVSSLSFTVVFCCSVGESARRPIGNLYKLDGKTGTVYSGQESGAIVRRAKGAENEGDQISHRKGGSRGVSRQMERNVEVCMHVHYLDTNE